MDKRRVGMEICPSGAEWCTHRAIETVPYEKMAAQAGFKNGTRPTKGLSLRDAERYKTVPYGKMERMRRLRATGVGRPYDKARKIA